MTSDRYLKKNCRWCETPLSAPFLELGDQPLANSFIEPTKANEAERFAL